MVPTCSSPIMSSGIEPRTTPTISKPDIVVNQMMGNNSLIYVLLVAMKAVRMERLRIYGESINN